MRAETNTRKNIEKITWIGLVANVALAVIKLIIGVTGSSQAVVADALHSFSDTASDLVILFGVRYWTAPPDDCHPFGHQKIESFVTIVISLIQRIPHVQGTHRIRSRKIGGSFYMDLHLEVEGQMSVRQGHEISETARQTLMARYPKVIDVMVHLEPADENPGIKPG
jgi:divalent metal cation (Fe/Co/Zn/Cd) transporter